MCNCNCNNCNCVPTVRSTSVAVTTTAVQITLPSNMTLFNGKAWKLIICQNLPDTVGSRTLPVQFIVNGITYNAYCYLANFLRRDMLNSRKVYCLQYGWDLGGHFTITSKNLNQSSFVPTS